MPAQSLRYDSSLRDRYLASMRTFLVQGGEAPLLAAYEIGREALAADTGILAILDVHRDCVEELMKFVKEPDRWTSMISSAADRFLDEVLSPYEMARLGGRETNLALHRLFDLLEQEAKRIAYALHDESAQMLATVYLELSEIRKAAPPEIADQMGTLSTHLDGVREQLRQLSHELRPLILDQLGLGAALEFLAGGVTKRTGLIVKVAYELEQRIEPSFETVLYRIAQEALVNVYKHAQANRADILVFMEAGSVSMWIEDDGVGLGVEGSRVKRGLGLISIQERVNALNGECILSTPDDGGLTLQVRIPL